MINRHVLKFGFGTENVPRFQCPRCQTGTFQPDGKIIPHQPSFSKNMYDQEWADWDVIELRLCINLVCSNTSCGELGVLRAEGGVEPDYNDTNEFSEWFKISTISPAPHIISLPNGLPESVKSELIASFEVYWQHKSLVANSLRNCIEALLTHFGVPDDVDGKWVSLGNRLRTYAKSHPNHAEFFQLLKPIINSGSHGNKIETETLLDAFESLEIFLHDVFNDRKKRFEKLKDRLRVSSL